jgi:serine protease Do
MRVLKMAAIVAALAGLAALAPSVYAQSRGRELTILGGRGGELGVRITDATSGGVEIAEVQPDGAAEKAGLKRGDIIVEFDGEHVRSGRQFARIVQETPAGRSVKATIVRDGKRQDLQVTPSEGRGSATIIDGGRMLDADRLRERFGDRFERARFDFKDFDHLRDLPFTFDFGLPVIGSSGRLGVEVDELTNQLAQYFGAKDGVLVTSVVDGSAASRAGIKAGDVITSINGTAVGSRGDLIRALRDVDAGAEVSIAIVRDRKEATVKATIEAPRRTLRGARPA